MVTRLLFMLLVLNLDFLMLFIKFLDVLSLASFLFENDQFEILIGKSSFEVKEQHALESNELKLKTLEIISFQNNIKLQN